MALLLLYSLWPWLPGQKGSAKTIVLYGFSILGEVIDRAVFPAFQAHWKERTGEDVELISSYGGSGTVTNQILLGVPAQLAVVALELDAIKLDKAHRLDPRATLPNSGVLNQSPFVILVRPGNPKGIHDFADLAKPGIGIVHPDPLTSGGAQWALLAEYGSRLRTGGTAEEAEAQLLGIWRNVVSQAGSGRAARTQFDSGFGDALITYEQDVLHDTLSGHLKGEIVYPACTVMSEPTVVTLPRNIPEGDREMVQAFVDFLWSDEAQKLFVESGFRSLTKRLNHPFAPLPQAFTAADLGGWPRAKQEIVEDAWKGKVLPRLHP